MVNDYAELNEEEKDILLELANIGTGNALTSLSQMTNCQIEMGLPAIKIIGIQHLAETLDEGADNVGVALRVQGSMDCIVTFILNEHFTKVVINQLIGEKLEDIHEMSDMQQSAICEIGNIMCNSYLNALAAILILEMDVSIPALEIGKIQEIFNVFSNEYKDEEDEVLFIKNTFFYSDEEVVSHILLQPKFQSIEEMLRNL